MKECPLCHQALITEFAQINRLICPTVVPETYLSHYYLEISNYIVEVIHTPPYTILNSNCYPTFTRVYHFNYSDIGKINERKLIMEIPKIDVQIVKMENLVSKIATYLTFS